MQIPIPTRLALASPLLAALAACSSTGGTGPEENPAGRGVLSWTRSAPADVEALAVPDWHVGDRFVYRRGGRVRYEFVVEGTGNVARILLEQNAKLRIHFDGELRERGRQKLDSEQLAVAKRPFDAELHWPLFAGKKWTCEFVDARDGGGQLVRAHYHCDEVEEITTAAGSFRCWRIWRTARLVSDKDFYDRTSVSWYSPEIGWFVRRLEGELLVELEEFERQAR